MAIARAVVTIPNSLMSSDGPASSNTLHFNVIGAVSLGAEAEVVADQVQACWEALGPLYSSGAATTINVRIYDLTDAEPRVPVHLQEFTIAPGEDSLPGECSINVSYRGARVSGVPSQRARGTLHLGPLELDTLDPATGHITSGARTIVADAFTDLAAAADPLNPWVVGSEAHGFVPVTVATVKNEFGTVRSRGLAVTASTDITLP